MKKMLIAAALCSALASPAVFADDYVSGFIAWIESLNFTDLGLAIGGHGPSPPK